MYQTEWLQISVPLFTSYVSLGKFHNLAESQRTLIFKVSIVSSLQNDEVMHRHIMPNAVRELGDV